VRQGGCRRARQAAWIGIGHTRAVADDDAKKEKLSPAELEQEGGFGDLRPYVPQDIINVSFPVSVRGYDRRAVDAYIKRVNRAIAELKVSASPPAAVRHALVARPVQRFTVSFSRRGRQRRRSRRAHGGKRKRVLSAPKPTRPTWSSTRVPRRTASGTAEHDTRPFTPSRSARRTQPRYEAA
jgi:DivIVA domain-containing protein